MNRNKLILIMILVLLLGSTSVYADDSIGRTYIVPIKGMITKASYNFLENEINNIIDNNDVRAIIFEIDTYGGLIDSAIDIKDLIIGLDVETISYVNNKAESAGVLIAIASNHVVMNETATIGSAETIPNDEKTLSLWRSVLRNTAEYRDINPKIIEGMADKSVVVKNINSKGKLINLTANEALKYKVSDFTAEDYGELLRKFDLNNSSLIRIRESLAVKVSKFISNPNISSFLLSLGFLGILIEIVTVGFGIGTAISVTSFGLYFGGNIMAGYGSITSIIFFITGIVLLIVEAIVPGFGLPGISGIILVVAGIILTTKSVALSIASVAVAILLVIIIALFIINRGMKSKKFNSIILDTKLNDEGNYLSTDNKDEYLGEEGVALTSLRPSGFIKIGDKKLDALSDEGLIKVDSKVKIVRVEGSKIFVRRI